jgi:quaternary ammonium compound-resistance protein SugE
MQAPYPDRKDDLSIHIIRGDDPALLGGFVMAWAVLFTAGLLEVGWAIGLKYTEGFTRLLPSVLTLAAMAGSIILLGLALKTLPIGTAYAVWTGIGAVGTAILGIALFGEPATAARLASIGLIVAGIAGLKLVS